MLLTVSIGNSHTAFAVHPSRGPGRRSGFRLQTDPRRTVDELGLWVADLLARDGLAPRDIHAACICSVVPGATETVVGLCRAAFGVAPLVVRPGVRSGLPVRYRPATSLGADRFVDAVAAKAAYGSPVIVVDFGTATTINVVDAGGAFVGGAIAPGIGIAAEALAAAGARLVRVDVEGPTPPLVGRTTESAVQSGLIHGHAALVDGLLGQIVAALDPSPAAPPSDLSDDAPAVTATPYTVPIVATGGWAAVMAPHVPRIAHVHSGLIHDGLRLVWQRRADARRAA